MLDEVATKIQDRLEREIGSEAMEEQHGERFPVKGLTIRPGNRTQAEQDAGDQSGAKAIAAFQDGIKEERGRHCCVEGG